MAGKPRILILNCGGTWSMRLEDGVLKPAREVTREDFHAAFPAVAGLCVYEVRPAFRPLLDSANMGTKHWTSLADQIAGEAESFDGFVVLMGTDTLEFTAPALAFALCDLDKPIILSGAQIRNGDPGSDAPRNVVNACRVAAARIGSNGTLRSALPEVAVVFGSRIMFATRCRKVREHDLDAFDSINAPLLGRIGLDIRINNRARELSNPRRGRQQPAWLASPWRTFSEAGALISLYPGITPAVLRAVGELHEGLVLAAFGGGNIPCDTRDAQNPKNDFVNRLSLEHVIRDLSEAGRPVVITTRCLFGQAEFRAYEGGEAAQRAGAVIANDLTPECAFVKLAWLLGSGHWPRNPKDRFQAIKSAVLTNVAGELNSNRTQNGIYGWC